MVRPSRFVSEDAIDSAEAGPESGWWRCAAGGLAAVSRRAWRVSTTAAFVLGLIATSWTYAHPDAQLFDESVRLAPGEAVVRPMAVHFHRLVATWAVDDPVGKELWLLVVPAEERDAVDAAPADAWFAARLEGDGRMSHLIACCDGIAYRHLLLVVRNDGEEPVDVALRAWAVHDDFAVVAARAEAGAVEVPLALFTLVGAGAVTAAVRDRRRRDTSVRPRGRALAWSAALFGAAMVMAAGLGVAGALRYGAGPIDGMIAILADVPVPGGLFGSRAAFVLAALLLIWVAAIAAWVVAVRQGAHRRSRWVVPMGAALALVSLVGGLAMSWTYGGSLVPVVLAIALSTPLAVSAWLLRGTGASATVA